MGEDFRDNAVIVIYMIILDREINKAFSISFTLKYLS